MARIVLVLLVIGLIAGCSGDQGTAASPEQTVQKNTARKAQEEKGE